MDFSRHRAICAIEALEDRNLMAVTAQLVDRGATLRILGDTAHEAVTIHQNDAAGTISVQWNTISPNAATINTIPPPVQEFNSAKIKRVVVNLKGGNDSLTYVVDGPTLSSSKSLNFDMGHGNDNVFIDMGGQLVVAFDGSNDNVVPTHNGHDHGDGDILIDEPNNFGNPVPLNITAPMNITVNGGAGNDMIDGVFGHARAGLSFRTYGGTGNDTLAASLAGIVAANKNVVIFQDGGTGNDQFHFNSYGEGIEVGGRVAVVQRGGAGDDHFDLTAFGAIEGTLLINQIGNTGKDTIHSIVHAAFHSEGGVRARLFGDTANDDMLLAVHREEVPPNVLLAAPLKNMLIEASVHGGVGGNRAWVTPNVKVFSAVVMESSWEVGTILPIDPWPF
jgi:hypothetical protein